METSIRCPMCGEQTDQLHNVNFPINSDTTVNVCSTCVDEIYEVTPRIGWGMN